VPFPVVVGLSALLGALGLPVRGPRAEAAIHSEPSLVDQLFAQGRLQHTAPDVRRALGTGARWLALWAAPVLALWWWRGGDDVLTRESLFFSEAAVVTFGGAYAVLAWVAHQVVSFGWLTAPQMLDGLGLAESTPGPLILVLEFAGFGAAYFHPGNLPPLLAGTLGAAVTVWVTFAPCFLWIFVFAPWVEALRANQRLGGALAAITASVVGVMANLSLFFALHVLFAKVDVFSAGPLSMPAPEWSSVDWRALAVSALAFVLLFGFKQGVGRTLLVCALMGAAVKFVG
jgi:chromate transporter